MANSLPDEIEHRAHEAASQYHRLVLVAGPPGSGKTTALRAVRDRTGAAIVNVGLELSRRLLELTERQRALRVSQVMEDLVAEASAAQPPDSGASTRPLPATGQTPAANAVLLDNIEIVFGPALEQDPLTLLQGLSRHRVVVAAWPGTVAGGWLAYADAGHPEHRRHLVAHLVVVDAAAFVGNPAADSVATETAEAVADSVAIEPKTPEATADFESPEAT